MTACDCGVFCIFGLCQPKSHQRIGCEGLCYQTLGSVLACDVLIYCFSVISCVVIIYFRIFCVFVVISTACDKL